MFPLSTSVYNLSSTDSENEVRSQTRPRNQQRTRHVPRPNNSRQVLSDSDADENEWDDVENESEWKDFNESTPSNINVVFEFHETLGPKHIPSQATKPLDFSN